MAESEEDFGSLDDNDLLQAYEDYQQQQEVGGVSSLPSSSPENLPGNATESNKSNILPGGDEHQALCSTSSNQVPKELKMDMQLETKTDTEIKAKMDTKIINLGNGTMLEIHVERKWNSASSTSSTSSNECDDESRANKGVSQLLSTQDNMETLVSFTQLLRSKYINVSDLAQQEWCEQQMVYTLSAKYGFVPAGVPLEEVELTTPAMKGGTKVHEQKDLEKNVYIPIEVSTREDNFALKLLNTVQSIKRLLLLGESCIREVPVFGIPYDYGFLVVGQIDELRINEHEQLELVEYKTRGNPHKPPGKAQIRTHHLQVMVYKQIVDDLVSGAIDMKAVLTKMRLDPERPLHDNLLVHARGQDIPGRTLGEVMATVLDQFQFLPKVGSMVVEYYLRDNDRGQLLSTDHVVFKEDWLKKRLESHFGFWRGEKEIDGVDIEELWKCNMCQFVNGCQWRQKMNEECLKKTKKK